MMTESPLFQELYQHWRRVKNPAAKASISRLLLDAKRHSTEINILRAERARERATDTKRPDVNGTRMTGAMHMLELEACRVLCPELRVGRGSVKTKAWEWVLKQPWAQDLNTAPMAKRFH